ncbi:MAG: YbaY family lipoprotein [Chloroflexota bacterium]
MRRLLTLFLPLVLLLAAMPALADETAIAVVSGTITPRDKAALGAGATAIVLLVDQQSGATGGTVIGTQRIGNAQWPVRFFVAYDPAKIDGTHSYALYASVIDGGKTFGTLLPTPVITGGQPTANVTLLATPPLPTANTVLPVTITRDDKSALSAAAFAVAALVRQDTGTVEAFAVVAAIKAEPIALRVLYDPGLIDPGATYAVRGGILDGSRTWAAPAPVPAISEGVAVPSVDLKVVGTSPSPSPTATAPPKPTPKPTPTASPKPTPKPTPTASPKPTPTASPSPTPVPTASPTPSPTASPTPAPTATPDASASATPEATPSPTPAPTATPSATPGPAEGTISGTVTWGERHVPTNASRLLVALLDTSSGDGAGRVITSQVLANPGMQPVVFSLSYARADLPAGDHYRVVAALLDGDLAWLNRDGVAVPVPEPAISGVVVPLSFKPDLLKAQVSGIVTGDGLDGAAAATSYASVVLLNETTGEILGYDAVSPIGAAPIAFSIPYSLTDIDQGGNYIVSATAWDGTRPWTQTQFARVITKGNPSVGVTARSGPARRRRRDPPMRRSSSTRPSRRRRT